MTPQISNKEILIYINDNFDYDPVTGILWRTSKKYGWAACTNYHNSHRFRVTIKYKTYYITNICWFLFYKEWPIVEIDHIDLDSCNNKIDNLRLSGHSKNSRNVDKRNSNEYIGVAFHKIGKKWRYRFSIDEKRYEVYGFKTAKEAARAREKHLNNLGDVYCARNKNLE